MKMTAFEFLKENQRECGLPTEFYEHEIAELMEWYADYYREVDYAADKRIIDQAVSFKRIKK